MDYGLNLTMKILVNTREDVVANLTLENHSNEDYYIYDNSILLNARESGTFYFNGPSEIECTHESIGSANFPHFKLSAKAAITSLVSLSDYCDFKPAKEGVYNVEFYTLLRPYTTPDMSTYYKRQDVELNDTFYLPGETVSLEEGA